MPLRIRNNQDFSAGVLFAAIACIVLYGASDLNFGTLVQMGPGFFPLVLAVLLACFALGLLGRSFFGEERTTNVLVSREASVILLAAVLFGVTIDPLGFIPATLLLVLVAACADRELSWTGLAALAVILTAGSTIVFVFLLQQPIALFGPYTPWAF